MYYENMKNIQEIKFYKNGLKYVINSMRKAAFSLLFILLILFGFK